MTKLILIVWLIVLALPVHAQDVKRKLDKTEFALITANYMVHTLDARSTRHFMSNGSGHEVVLPSEIVDHTWSTYLWCEGTATANAFASHYFETHGHKTLARSMLLVDIGLSAYAGIHNYTLRKPDTITVVHINVPVTH